MKLGDQALNYLNSRMNLEKVKFFIFSKNITITIVFKT